MLNPQEIADRLQELNKKEKELAEERHKVRDEVNNLIAMWPLSYQKFMDDEKSSVRTEENRLQEL